MLPDFIARGKFLLVMKKTEPNAFKKLLLPLLHAETWIDVELPSSTSDEALPSQRLKPWRWRTPTAASLKFFTSSVGPIQETMRGDGPVGWHHWPHRGQLSLLLFRSVDGRLKPTWKCVVATLSPFLDTLTSEQAWPT